MACKKYLRIFNVSENYTYGFIRLFSKKGDNQYSLHVVGNYGIIEDTGYITVCPTTKELDPSIVQKRVDQIEYIHTIYPNIKMYVYYVSQAFDTSWFDSYLGATAANHYSEIAAAIPSYVRSDYLKYQDLSDYMNIHYKTDHHWNHRGARRGYENIYSMMNEDFALGKMRIPVKENRVSETYEFSYLGSYGRSLGDLYNEGYDDFSFYDYGLPKMDMMVISPITLEETEVDEIGLYNEYENGIINKDIGSDHYIIMYGTAKDADGNEYVDSLYPYVIKNAEGNGMNLIITGDSYDRAMRDVLASHFDTTVYLDYRTLSKVPIDYIIEKYDIDVILISSHTSMWESEEYLFTFKVNQ